jgi:hypothetical protein
MERIASGLNVSVLELLGFEAQARRALKKSSVDYDHQKEPSGRSLARQTRSRNILPGDLSIPVSAQSFLAGRLRRGGGQSLPIAR